ncbi:DNA-binding protein [Variovorax ureilyticus]|uniref:DNA-binding protein n=1 Tax=Variovorax ureilyticus TaxID=1836198 RepID=UPI003D671BE3
MLRALSALNRFRVIRTFDIAALCGPERPFKAALTAAQKAVRGMKKAGLVQWYRTDRQQHVYGLTKKGADLLQEHGIDSASSVRRVNDMTNPEHMLWASFIAVCCEVRGLRALTEPEFLRELNRGKEKGALVQGLLNVDVGVGNAYKWRALRPDVVAYEPDGATWFEIDRSKRGSAREASLGALFKSMGARTSDGQPLRRIVVLAKTDRILGRAVAIARAKLESKENPLTTTNNVLREIQCGLFEVVGVPLVRYSDGTSSTERRVLGHVIIQMLPTWLPKVRISKGEEHSTGGWFSENYLPYRRPALLGSWPEPRSPFLSGAPDPN